MTGHATRRRADAHCLPLPLGRFALTVDDVPVAESSCSRRYAAPLVMKVLAMAFLAGVFAASKVIGPVGR
jgi:hypothetical protein